MPSSCQGNLSHVSDPGKPEGSHFILTKNRDSMPTADRGKEEGKASLGKPKSGSTEWYVTEEVNPIDKTRLSEKQARFANTKKKSLSSLLKSLKALSQSMMRCTMNCLHQLTNQMLPGIGNVNLD